MQLVSNFAERLKEYMHQHDMTFDTLSKKTGIPAQTLNRYSLGQRIPKVDVAADIAIKLNVDPLWLQGFDTHEDAKNEKEAFKNKLIDMGIVSPDRDLSNEDFKKLSSIISAFLNSED
jgi:toxin-antitoxin system, antitoxin component, xre family